MLWFDWSFLCGVVVVITFDLGLGLLYKIKCTFACWGLNGISWVGISSESFCHIVSSKHFLIHLVSCLTINHQPSTINNQDQELVIV